MKVLTVEDSKVANFVIVRALKLYLPDIEVLNVRSGIEAIKLYVTFKPDFVTMDMNIETPENGIKMNGLETSVKLHEIDPHVKIVLISFNKNADYNKYPMIKAVIIKPFKPEQIEPVLRKLKLL